MVEHMKDFIPSVIYLNIWHVIDLRQPYYIDLISNSQKKTYLVIMMEDKDIFVSGSDDFRLPFGGFCSLE